jgi:hypothetical protein
MKIICSKRLAAGSLFCVTYKGEHAHIAAFDWCDALAMMMPWARSIELGELEGINA